MKTECSVVRDLLPLYVENMVSPETAQFVSDHLKECSECRSELESLKEGEPLSTVENRPAADTGNAKPFKNMSAA